MISGRRYLSSLRAAKEHGYHSDYIGQLIRGNKIKGQKVGRAWYVDAESLSTYLGKTAVSPPEPPSESPRVSSPDRDFIAAEARPDFPLEAPATILAEEKSASEITDPEEHHIPIVKVAKVSEPAIKISIPSEKKGIGLRYVTDDAPLLPEIHKGQKLSRPPEVIIQKVPVKTSNKRPAHSAPRTHFWQGAALMGLGVFVLIAITAISALFVSHLSVGSVQSASIQFSLPE